MKRVTGFKQKVRVTVRKPGSLSSKGLREVHITNGITEHESGIVAFAVTE
jgi:hypothetical protein